MKKLEVFFILLIFSILLSANVAKANDNKNLDLYNEGVKNNIINKEKYTYTVWKKTILSELSTNYNEIPTNESATFNDWVKLNNYGIVPRTDDNIVNTQKNTVMLRSATTNINAFVKSIKAGDIIFTTKYTFSGFIGH
ncbi:hypothetical protein [Listeria sp. PSOL-1]|uniref:hypothetical protein n=1 Tax=Listeria sp. PSOL-1 TaxID=1844999 RepID=UPI0013D8AC30|nr:hypothetical protein [Listeria sp. PSOL-1]